MLRDGDFVLLVDGASLNLNEVKAKITSCAMKDVPHLGGGIYDVIVFPTIPPDDILEKSLEKVYWGGYVIVQGICEKAEKYGFTVVSGDPSDLVLQRPPAPPYWSEEYYLKFQPKGIFWNPVTKATHPSYLEKFKNIDVNWKGKTVIEYGCGRGEITRLIALAGSKKVYAVDSASAAVALTSKFCSDLHNVEIVLNNALTWVCDEDVDVIVAIDFVEHIPEEDLAEMLKMWYNSLSANGIVHILTPLGGDAVRDHKWAPTPGKLRELVERAGFKEKRHVRPKDSRKFYAEFGK